jgi:uncharacterized SAM-binding protein YcdF (DUF218 family)
MGNAFDCFTDLIFVETEIAQADIILIPGASQASLMERAVELYKRGLSPYILPSGGEGNRQVETTEWAFLRDVALENGIPKEVILQEDKAQHTFENARFSLEVLRMSGIEPKKVILVCKATHSRRALLTYQTVFPKETEFMTSPIIDRTGITKENWYLSEEGINNVMKEVEKIGLYFGKHISNWVQR